MSIKDKIKILEDGALKNLEKKYGKEAFYLGNKKIPPVPLICSSGSIALDHALCIGGFPEGRVIEIGGQESSGKSTLTLLNIAEIQRNEKLCAYLDVEQSFDPTYAQRLGVDVENLLISQPETMEETFEILFELISSKVISYIVVDSTNAMIPEKMLKGDTDTALMGKSALLMSQQLPKVVSLASTNKCTVVFISQIRSKIGVVYGSPEKIGVGEAMKFYASQRLKVNKSDIQKDDYEGQDSVDITVTVFKNKVGVPYRKASFTLLTGKDGEYGIDKMKEIIEFAIKYDIVEKAGSWYSFGEERLGQGLPNVKKFFQENPTIYTQVEQQIKDNLAKEREKLMSIESFDSKVSDIADAINDKRRKKKDEKVEKVVEVQEQPEIKEAEIVEG